MSDNTQLQPHQVRALKKLQLSDKGILAYHGLGSGKTLTGLAAAKYNGGASVIGPAALKDNFHKENKKHKVNADVDYSTYSKPDPKKRNLVIYDEAHRMGRADSKRSKYPNKYPADKTLLLTGTPIRNEPAELAPLLNAVGVRVPTDPKAFNDRYVENIKVTPSLYARFIKGIKPGTVKRGKNLDRLSDKIEGKVDYQPSASDNFPQAIRLTRRVEMSKDQIDAYNMAQKGSPSLAYKIKYGLPPSKSEAGAMNAFLNATRQISNTPHGYQNRTYSELSPKTKAILKDIKKNYSSDPNYKGMTYSNYLDSGVDRLEAPLSKSGIPYAKFTGELNDKQKKQVVQNYNSGKIKHLLVSGAGAEGLDLKGTKLVQIMEPHWNKARIDQVTGRAIRYKSHDHLPEDQRKVKVIDYKSTIPGPKNKILKKFIKPKMSTDQYIAELAETKQRLNDQFLDVLKES